MGDESARMQEKGVSALQNQDWRGALALASKQLESNPKDVFWVDVAYIATMRIALEEAPRIRQTPGQLSGADRRELIEVSQKVGKLIKQPDHVRKQEMAGILPLVKSFAERNPDLPSGWILQAQISLLLNRPLDGKIAGRNLEELLAWETTNQNILLLLAQMQTRGWLPAASSSVAQQKRLADLAARLSTVPAGPEAKEKLAALLGEVKIFCTEHPTSPNGWLLQMNVASVLQRPLEVKIAQSKLGALRKTASKPAGATP